MMTRGLVGGLGEAYLAPTVKVLWLEAGNN